MRLAFLLFGLFAITGCMLFDPNEEASQEPIPATPVAFSCTDLWKHYNDELQLINDDEANWRAHDDNAVQYVTQFADICNVADTREIPATELRCKALGSIYMKESGRMTKDDRTWREHDLQQVEAMNRIRSNCNSTACKFLPGIRCLVPNSPS
jgi:hypothetical protein